MQIEENITKQEIINLIKFKVELGIEFFSENLEIENIPNDKKYENIYELENYLKNYCMKKNIRFVSSIGDYNLKVLLIGNNLGEDEIKENTPYVGKNKILLEKMLSSINLTFENVFSLNIHHSNQDNIDFFEIIIKYLEFIKPSYIINMSDKNIINLLEENSSKNFYLINIPDPDKLTNQPSLKRMAWENLKKLKLKMQEDSFR